MFPPGCQRPIVHVAMGAAMLLWAGAASAQRDDAQIWFKANTVVPLNKHFRLTLEQIARVSDRQNGLYTTEFGGILGYRLTRHVEIGFGYRRVDSYNGNTGRGEDRVRQHLIFTYGPVTGRFRVDERFNPGGDEIGFRIRPLIRYNHKVGKHGYALFVSHESFYLPNSTKWGQREGYERMRNLLGVVLPLGEGVSADLAYLNQYRPGRGGGQAQMDHAVNFQLTVNLGAIGIHKAHD